MLRYFNIIALSFFFGNQTMAYANTIPQATAWMGIPFAGLLLSLAVLPLVAGRLWHYHYGKIAALWAAAVLIPMGLVQGWPYTLECIAHTYILEYFPFLILVTALYIIAGGIKLEIAYHGSPTTNTFLLIIGTFAASVISTTGAAMLFIRPLLKINAWRTHRRHIVIFFIFLVCNIGGALTALGDPPLFLGFLNGVPFFWATLNLWYPFLLLFGPLIGIFWLLDTYYYRQEDAITIPESDSQQTPVKIAGLFNIGLLGVVMASVILSGVWQPGIQYTWFGTTVPLQDLCRNGALIGCSMASLWFSPREYRLYNNFTWEPVVEVTKLFAAIFITAIPVFNLLDQDVAGPFAPLVKLVTNAAGAPNNNIYFWITGGLSAVLDNAPTYLVFFHMAGDNAPLLTGPLSQTLIAISSGAVFMGALTYIGNAPNFMAKSIAEAHKVSMPSFLGYLGWSLGIMGPCLGLISYLCF